MKVGFDFWGCINQHPEQFREMGRAFIAAGHEVYIVSAYGDRQLEKYQNDEAGYVELIKSFEVPCTDIVPVYFGRNDKDIPELKLERVEGLGITLFFDDRPSTIELLHKHGIAAFLVPKPIKREELPHQAKAQSV